MEFHCPPPSIVLGWSSSFALSPRGSVFFPYGFSCCPVWLSPLASRCIDSALPFSRGCDPLLVCAFSGRSCVLLPACYHLSVRTRLVPLRLWYCVVLCGVRDPCGGLSHSLFLLVRGSFPCGCGPVDWCWGSLR